MSNAGTTDDTGAALTDTLPNGLLAVLGSASTTCGGTASTPSTSTVTLAGGTIPAGSSCVVTVDVTAAAAGSYINSLGVGALTSSNGSNAAPAIATLTVNAPTILPTLGKAFSPATIGARGVSTLTITLTNSNSTAATITSPLIDRLPIGLVVSGSPGNTCGGTATASTSITGISMLTLTGGSIPAGGSCEVTVNVTAPVTGSYFNSLAAGALVTSNGINAGVSVATLTVNAIASISLTKAFSPTHIKAGEVSILTITLTNSNSTDADLTAPLVDNLPSGLVIASQGGSTTCGGMYSGKPGATTATLTGGTIPANDSCTVTVYVTAAKGGSFVNTIPVGALQTNLGSNVTAAVAALTVCGATPTPTYTPRPTPKPTCTPTPTPKPTCTPKPTPKPTPTPRPTPTCTPKPAPRSTPTPKPKWG